MVAKETTFTTIPLTEIKSKLFVYNWLPQKYVLEEMDCVPKAKPQRNGNKRSVTQLRLYWTLTSSYPKRHMPK